MAEGIREAFADLFAVNTSADTLLVDEVHNKLRTLYKSEKKDTVIRNIAKTFFALCEYADFSSTKRSSEKAEAREAPSTAPSEQRQIEGSTKKSERK